MSSVKDLKPLTINGWIFMQLENITLFTDASYAEYPDFLGHAPTAGGAFWAKGGSESTIKQCGRFHIEGAKSSTDAEMLAALHSIGFLLENPGFHEYFSKGSMCRLILVTDCTAIQKVLIERKGSILKGHVATLFNQVFNSIDSLGFQLRVNWVKAHSGEDSARSWVNRFCDRHAKLAREDQIKSRIRNDLRQTYLDLTGIKLYE
jgi:hypothetical protein